MTANSTEELLQILDLAVGFRMKGAMIRVLSGVTLSVNEGEIVGVVGESGAGKTMLAYSILGLLPEQGAILSGRISWLGQNLTGLPEKAMRAIRGKQITMIFQDAQASLNPVLTISSQLLY